MVDKKEEIEGKKTQNNRSIRSRSDMNCKQSLRQNTLYLSYSSHFVVKGLVP
jgi:hypothetical protein